MTSLRLTSLLMLACLVPAAEGGQQLREAQSAAVAARAPRILYSSDWSGTSQIYAVDPSRRAATGQITFGRAPACPRDPERPCGFRAPTLSPDNRRMFFWDYMEQDYLRRSLFVAGADGRRRHRVALTQGSIVEAAWAPDSSRVAYTGTDGIHVVGVDGSSDRLVPTTRAGDHSPAWSPDGRSIAFVTSRGEPGDLVVVTGRNRRVAARRERGLSFAWSPDGRWLAVQGKGLFIERPDGSGRRNLAENLYYGAWSPDGRLLALFDSAVGGVRIYDVRSGRTRTMIAVGGGDLVWSPNGRLLAMDSSAGITIADVTTAKMRLLTKDHSSGLAWSPDGDLLAYVEETFSMQAARNLRVVGLAGNVRTIVAVGGSYGGRIGGFVWTKPPPEQQYRRPAPRSLATASGNELTAPWTVTRLATDGGRVAYVACGHVFVWTPSAGSVEQAEPVASLSPRCNDYAGLNNVHTLAIADERVAFGLIGGGNTTFWWLGGTTSSLRRPAFTLGEGRVTTATPRTDFVADLAGSGSLLVFSSADQEWVGGQCCSVKTIRQEVVRAGPTGCPCPVLATEPGPFVPYDVDSGRIAAAGDNAVVLLDAEGARLLTVPMRARSAQLAGDDLVFAVDAELRHHHARTGELLRTWPLTPSFRLEDAARGLVVYVVDGQVHVLRLADGVDATIGPGTLARFMDAGLVYADGVRLHLMTFDRLPLR